MGTTSTNFGKVKFFNDVKKYGFISDNNDGKEYFFHVSGTLDKVMKDDQVAYDLESTDRGVKAVNVKRVKT